jgi:hypothetical protein
MHGGFGEDGLRFLLSHPNLKKRGEDGVIGGQGWALAAAVFAVNLGVDYNGLVGRSAMTLRIKPRI